MRMDSLSEDEDCENEDVVWKSELQKNRMLIVNNVEFNKISPALQSALVIDGNDNEQIKNPYINPTSSARGNEMINVLLRRGKKNYEKFLEILGGYYPDIYKKMTGRDPPPAVHENMYVDDLSDQVLSFIFAKLSEKKRECAQLMRENQSIDQKLKENTALVAKLHSDVEEYAKKEDRHQRLESEFNEFRELYESVSKKNSEYCGRLEKANETQAQLLNEKRSLLSAIEERDHLLRQLENRIDNERTHSIRLRNQLDTGPSERDVLALKREIKKLKLQAAQSYDEGTFLHKDVDTQVEILQHDLRTLSESYEEAMKELTDLRNKLEETETVKTKYFEECESLKLKCSELTSECQMHKRRRDGVWEQLQGAEKERDQLMKERNIAQLTAQTYMEEKTRYRYEIHQLEEQHDDLSDQLKQREKELQEVKAQLGALRKDSVTSLDSIEELPNDVHRRGSNCDSLVSYASIDSTTGESRRVRMCERRQRFLTATSDIGDPEKRGRSLSSAMKLDIFHKLVEADGEVHSVKISGKNLQSTIEFVGGNETGIFIGSVTAKSYADVIGLVPGMEVLKIKISTNDAKEVHFRNCTLENAVNLFQEIDDYVMIDIQYKEKEFKLLQERSKQGKISGDSFYVRTNFALRNKEGFLNFGKGAILHVVNTRFNSKDWLAYHVDLTDGEDAGKSGKIPSYGSYMSNSQFFKSIPSLSKSTPYLQKLFSTMPGSQDFCVSLDSDSIRLGNKACPYTVIKRAPTEINTYRPCIFTPLSLSKSLSFKLTTMTGPHEFDLPTPKSVRCDEDEAHRRVISTEAITCNKISSDMHELVTIESVQTIMQKKKHCILTYNEKCTSLDTFVTLMHLKEIYPIIVHFSAEKEKSLKILLDQDQQKELSAIIARQKRDQEILDRYIPTYSTIHIDKCARLEDVVSLAMDRVANESKKVVWVSGKSDVHI